MLTYIPPGHVPRVPNDWVCFEFLFIEAFFSSSKGARGTIFDEVVQILSDYGSEGYYKVTRRDTEVHIDHYGQTHSSSEMVPLWYMQVVVSPEMMMIIKMRSKYADQLKNVEFEWED